LNEIRSAQEELSKAFSEAGQSFYAQAQTAGAETAGAGGGATGGAEAGTAGAGAAGTGGRPDDVVEADYEIVDESKK
jgi:molecular chaperone DnaK